LEGNTPLEMLAVTETAGDPFDGRLGICWSEEDEEDEDESLPVGTAPHPFPPVVEPPFKLALTIPGLHEPEFALLPVTETGT